MCFVKLAKLGVEKLKTYKLLIELKVINKIS